MTRQPHRSAGIVRKDAALPPAFGTVSLDFKRAGDDRLEGYAAIFGNVDQGFDVIEPGAFADSLKSGRKVRFLWQHNPDEVIGTWEDMAEDDKGLRVKGRLLAEVQRGAEAFALLKAGAIDGLSIGYRVKEWREMKLEDGRWVRVIEKADLWEVSLVTFPMNTEATIDAKSAVAMTRKEFGRELLRHSPLSRQVVDALMRDGWKGVQALSKSGGADLSELTRALEARIGAKQQLLT